MEFDASRRHSDLVYEAGTLLADELDLETATQVLLGCDARARTGDPLSDDAPKRGWWGDTFDPDGEELGSHLWLLEQAEATPQNAARAKDYAQAALKTIVDQKLVKAMAISSELSDENIFVEVLYTLHDGGEVRIGPFSVTRR